MATNKVYRNFNQLPLVGRFFRKFDQQVARWGLQPAMRLLINHIKVKFQVNGLNKKTKKILASKPVILVSNHPHASDVVLLVAALPERKDINMIASFEFLSIGPSFASHLIPVYLKEKVHKSSKKLSSRLCRHLNLVKIFPDEECQEKNKRSLKKAVKKIEQNSLVIIFPEGEKEGQKLWLPGVVKLLKQLLKNKKEVFYVQAYVKGTSFFDPFRRLIKIGWLFPKIKVSFSSPQPIRKILEKDKDCDEMAQNLREKYWAWVKTLN